MKKLITLFTLSIVALGATAQTARVQAIHNSADAAADTVDVWLTSSSGSVLLLENFYFRSASPFVSAPANEMIRLNIAGKNSSSIADTIPGLGFSYMLADGETYVLVAEGIVSPSGYNPATPFDIKVYAMGREVASMNSNTDVLVHHGSTDAPTVDVRERTLGTVVVDDASFGDFSNYLELPTSDYILDVQTSDNSTTVASYSAPLSTLGLDGASLVVVASGFLDPSNNSDGAAFGLFVALASGGDLVALPTTTGPTARVQIIHNSADAVADSVDVYLDGSLLLDNFAFRNATPFVNVPATQAIQVAIAAKNSTSVNEALATFDYNLAIDERYVIIAEGIVSGTGYEPATPFDLSVYPMARELAVSSMNTDVLVHHGSTDAPCVDIEEETAGLLVNNACFGNFAGYLELPTDDYRLIIKDTTGTNSVAAFDAPLAQLNLEGNALVVVASGFFTPENNSDGPDFGLYVAVPGGGEMLALPASSTLSTNSIDLLPLGIAPNPANNAIQLRGLNGSSNSVLIMDNQGRSLINTTIGEEQIIDVSQLAPGFYYLEVFEDGQLIALSKFIKA